MSNSQNCIFCKIVKGDIPAYKIFENDEFLAFFDVNPTAEAHTLVIPKKHYEFVWDVENVGDYMKACKQIAEHYRKVTNNQIVYSVIHGEGVPHAHIHLIPKTDEKWSKTLNDAFPTDKLDPEKAKQLLDKYKI